MGSVGTSKNPNIMSLVHYTQEQNIPSLLKSEFDMSRAGEGAGTAWGAGAYYLEKGSYEDDMYSTRLYTESYIKSDIDTSNFLTVDTLKDTSYRGVGKMYDDAAKAFPRLILKDYNKLVRRYKIEGMYSEQAKKQAFIDTAKHYYEGLIIKHRVNGGEYIDPLSGGNQVVVYNQSAIKNKKAGKNK